ncbi:hypothetical protein QJS10_CPA07g00459 [Acorus calamus]|uniref:CASP-like protein n=1 Tax=Acorus calamus TaxID=4465 RepID=A0AAV9EE66_ACOCL|nr:hypothetical protein QJS10_CPA07g00459 [Acorus calamus]
MSSPGNVPVKVVVDRRVKIAEVVLRCLVCGLGVLVAALVGTDTQVKEIFSIEKKAKFTDMKSLLFLVVTNGIVAGYSLIQGIRCVVSMIKGRVLFNKALAWAIFSCDQVMAYVTLAALAAATQSAMLAEEGQVEMQWLKVCGLYGSFCTQIGEGIVAALVVSLTTITISSLSAFNLFRLYGGHKRIKNCGGW